MATVRSKALTQTTMGMDSVNEASQTRPHTVQCHLCDTSRMGKSIETEKRPLFARAGGEVCGGDCFLSTGFPSGKMKMFWN